MKPSEGHGVQARCSAVDREEGPDLSVTVNGLKLPNPFLIASGPPGTNYTVMKRAFDEGWGGVIAKTVSLDSEKVVNVTPRYAKLKAWAPAGTKSEVIGWENIELISDRPFETMLAELQQLKKEYPDRILVASIMEEYHRSSWEEIIERVEATGVDALEINLGCAHGKMGAAMGQDCVLLEEVCGWINAKASVPIWAKMTPNVTDITQVGSQPFYIVLNFCGFLSVLHSLATCRLISSECESLFLFPSPENPNLT
jgi:dihydropyrimidine dehydrogenase (NADP+)